MNNESRIVMAILFLLLLPRKIISGLIFIYQKTLSPDHGPLKILFPHGYCPYYPTCSQYGKKAVMAHGVFKGLPMAIWRVVRCNPWTKGGIDEVPGPRI